MGNNHLQTGQESANSSYNKPFGMLKIDDSKSYGVKLAPSFIQNDLSFQETPRNKEPPDKAIAAHFQALNTLKQQEMPNVERIDVSQCYRKQLMKLHKKTKSQQIQQSRSIYQKPPLDKIIDTTLRFPNQVDETKPYEFSNSFRSTNEQTVRRSIYKLSKLPHFNSARNSFDISNQGSLKTVRSSQGFTTNQIAFNIQDGSDFQACKDKQSQIFSKPFHQRLQSANETKFNLLHRKTKNPVRIVKSETRPYAGKSQNLFNQRRKVYGFSSSGKQNQAIMRWVGKYGTLEEKNKTKVM